MELIDKAAVVAEIERLKKSHDNWSCMGKCFHQEYEHLLSFIDTLEVKEDIEHYELEEFARIVRGNLTGIDKTVQTLFEAKYQQLTGHKMYGGYKD